MKNSIGALLKKGFSKTMFNGIRLVLCKPIMNLFTFFGSFKMVCVGRLIVFVPTDKLKKILNGVDFLRQLDPVMFSRLTSEHRYVCTYSKKWNQNQEFFTIADEYLAWGKEGVVVCLINAIFEFDLVELPLRKGLIKNTSDLSVARFEVVNQLYLWLEKNSFHRSIIQQYQTGAEKRKQQLLLKQCGQR